MTIENKTALETRSGWPIGKDPEPTKAFTFEMETLKGEYRPIFGTCSNRTDLETGKGLFVCSSESVEPYKAYGQTQAFLDFAYFTSKAWPLKVRFAQ